MEDKDNIKNLGMKIDELNNVKTREKVKRKLRTISMGKTKLTKLNGILSFYGNNILFLHCIPFLYSFLSKQIPFFKFINL